MVYIINLVIMFLLGIIWTKGDWANFIIKVIFFVVAFANAFYAAQMFGYVIKL